MSYNHNYGSYYGSSQSTNQQQHQQYQPHSSTTYSTPSYQAYNAQRSSQQPSSGFSAQEAPRYQYPQPNSADNTGSSSGWSTLPRHSQLDGRNVNASNTLGVSHNSSVGPAHYAHTQAEQNNTTHATYGNYAQAHFNSAAHTSYGQQLARTDSVSSAGSVAPPPQQYQHSHQQRVSQDMRNPVRSPLHAQAQQNLGYQPTRTNVPTRSPNVSHQSNSTHGAAPSRHQQQSQQHATATGPTTVDPSQVYDRSAEIQREVAKAEARRAEEARRKAEEERRAAEEAERKKREDAEHAKKLEEARKLSQKGAAAASNTPKKKKSRKSNADKAANGDAAANAAAMTLMQTANLDQGAPGTDLEAQMKAMFAKMREFNAANPEMLSRLWQQERESYLAGESDKPQTPQGEQAAAQDTSTASNKKPKKKRTPKKDKPASTTTTEAHANMSAPRAQAPATAQQQVNGTAETPKAAAAAEKTASKTIWPEKRKNQLAQAASSLIQKMPENGGRTIPFEEISRLLDSNPSYLELCNQIEARGFKLNKSQFAKALLTAVPEVNKQKANASLSSPQAFSTSTFTPANGSANDTQQARQANALGDAESRLLGGESIIGKSSNGGRPRKSGETPSKKKSQMPPSAQEEPGFTVADDGFNDSLEGLDAVRRFNETPRSVPDGPTAAFSPTSESKKNKKPKASATPAPPLPQTKEDQARKRTFADLVDLTALSDEEGPPAKRMQVNGNSPAAVGQSQPQSTQQQQPPAAPQAPMVPAMGQQQPQGPAPFAGQPGHLQNYPQPTFNVYPAPTQPKMQHHVPRDHPIHNFLVGEKIAKPKVLRRSKYNRKTIARDVLLATGRHPDMRHLNAHLDILRNLKVKDDTDLSTVRWDIIDPGGAVPGAGISNEPLPEDEEFADDESSEDETARAPVQSIPVGGGGAVTAVPAAPQYSGNPSFRIKNYKRKSEPGPRAKTTPQKPPMNTAAPASAGGSSYAALRAATGQAKRGRPVGWRKWMQKDNQGSPSAPDSSTGAKRGRPPGSGTGSKPAPKPPSPEFPTFKCEWEGCTAELHNLETLRRHIHKLHGEKRSGSDWTCKWSSCGEVKSVKEGPRTVSRFERLVFDGSETWKPHVEDEHLLQIKWKQGDGPAGGLTDNDGELSDAVLSDREGRQVTPRIAMPGSPIEAWTRAEEERSQGSQGPVPEAAAGRRRTPLEEARMEAYSAEERRRRLGVGIDKGGSRMVTDKRRRGFVEDGDVEMASDGDEG